MKITNKRDLALAIDNGGKVKLENIGKGLNRIVNLWISYKEAKIENGYFIGLN